jgi:hypothetical protein
MTLLRISISMIPVVNSPCPKVTINGSPIPSTLGMIRRKEAWCMATYVEVIRDPLFTATVGDLLEELRGVIDYLMTSNAEVLKDFPAGDDQHAVLFQALGAVRAMAAVVTLDKLLQKNHSGDYTHPVARPAGAGPHIIDIDEGKNSSTDRLLRHQRGR